MISESTWRESWRGLRPPTDGTSTVSSADTSAVSAHPYRFLMSSASAIGVRRPMAMSFEMWSPPSGRTAVCQIAPLRRSATSVVPPPRSTTTIPSSFSSSYRTASAEASGSRITSWTARPARFTDRTTFWTEVTAAVTMCTSTSRRTPDMPMGSRIPSPSSTMKFWGRTWMISRSCGRLIARAASTARSTSVGPTSRSLPDTATTPRLLTPRMCPPAMPAQTPATSTPAICSASATAALIASTVESIWTTIPRRRPRCPHRRCRDRAGPAGRPPRRSSSSPRPAQRPGPAPSSAALRASAPEDDLTPEPQIHRADVPAGHLGKHALEARQALFPVLGAQPHLDAVDGIEQGPILAAHVDLGDLGGERAPGPEQGPDQRDGGQCFRARRATHRRELVVGEAAHDRHLRHDRLGRGAEEPAFLVHPVQATRVNEREGAPLLDGDDDPVRELADDVRTPDLGDGLHTGGDGARVEAEQVRSGLDGGGGQDPCRRHAGGAAHVHAHDGKAR